MKIEYEQIRLTVFTTIMLALTVAIISLVNTKRTFVIEERTDMEDFQLLEFQDIQDGIIPSKRICYLYKGDTLSDAIIKGKVIAQDNSTVANVCVYTGGDLVVAYNATCASVRLEPGATIRIELDKRLNFMTFKNEGSYPILIPEITDDQRSTENDHLEIPVSVFLYFPKELKEQKEQ